MNCSFEMYQDYESRKDLLIKAIGENNLVEAELIKEEIEHERTT